MLVFKKFVRDIRLIHIIFKNHTSKMFNSVCSNARIVEIIDRNQWMLKVNGSSVTEQ